MRLDGVSSCMGQLVWKRKTENRRETCLYCSCTTFSTYRTWLQFTLPTRSFRCFHFFKIFNFQIYEIAFRKNTNSQYIDVCKGHLCGSAVLAQCHLNVCSFHQPDPCTNANLCRDSRATLIGGLLRSSKPGGKPQPSEKVVQRCHHDSLGGTNFRACHVTRRRFTKFASRAYFRMPMYLFS